ncbi:MAG: hypothetical protein GX557_02790 [Chloroflexi bacterium]|nr:hypothetical protein [Chloroflexota bacterium]
MPTELTKRERVERAMACRETDRVPLYDILLNDAAIEHYNGRRLPSLSDEPATVNLLEHMTGRAVAAFLDMTRSVGFGPRIARDSTDVYGFVRHQDPREKTTWIVSRPFRDERGARDYVLAWAADRRAEAVEIRRNPGAHREREHRQFLEVQARIDDTVNLLAQHGTGLDDLRHTLGFELFAYLEADEPGLIGEALEAMTDRNVAECHAIADATLSPAVLTYGDIAAKGALLHAPGWLRREFYPRLKRLNDAWHEHGLICLFHSDGYLMEALDDLLACEIDGLNPIETVAGMDLKSVRERCPMLFLAGGIDMSQLLSNGSPEEVRQVCRQAVRDAYPGFLMGSTTESDNSCKLENLLAMYDISREALP